MRKLDPANEGASSSFLDRRLRQEGRRLGPRPHDRRGGREPRGDGDGNATFLLAQAGTIAWRQLGNLIRARVSFQRLSAVAPEHPQLRAFEAQIGETLQGAALSSEAERRGRHWRLPPRPWPATTQSPRRTRSPLRPPLFDSQRSPRVEAPSMRSPRRPAAAAAVAPAPVAAQAPIRAPRPRQPSPAPAPAPAAVAPAPVSVRHGPSPLRPRRRGPRPHEVDAGQGAPSSSRSPRSRRPPSATTSTSRRCSPSPPPSPR